MLLIPTVSGLNVVADCCLFLINSNFNILFDWRRLLPLSVSLSLPPYVVCVVSLS